MAKISVITPTVRHSGLELVGNALAAQTFKDYEWIIICPQGTALPKYNLKRSKLLILYDPPPKKDDVWTLNKAYNLAIKQASGELVISWQDYTFAQSNALERFWAIYQQFPKGIVSGIGHKYNKVLPKLGKLIWKDPRETDNFTALSVCSVNNIEANFCAVPKQAFYEVGGFDEELDKFFGMDAFSVFDRLNMLGSWQFFLDPINQSYSLPHCRLKGWEEKNALHGQYQIRRLEYLKNPVLEYLK